MDEDRKFEPAYLSGVLGELLKDFQQVKDLQHKDREALYRLQGHIGKLDRDELYRVLYRLDGIVSQMDQRLGSFETFVAYQQSCKPPAAPVSNPESSQ
jgi:hypothetical protein